MPAGEVVATDPDPGSRVLGEGTVTLTVSLGKERYDVPDLAGMTEDQAQDALADANLSFGKSVERWNEVVPAGTVIRSDPEAGKTLKPDAAVDLVVSKGKQPIKLKDWTGKSADEAEQAMTEKGLEVERVGEEYSDDVPEGDVLSQTPASGTLFRGETVELVVSQGPELVAVPDGLVPMGVDAATERLTDLGFQVEVEQGSAYLGLGYVMDVDPDGGTCCRRARPSRSTWCRQAIMASSRRARLGKVLLRCLLIAVGAVVVMSRDRLRHRRLGGRPVAAPSGDWPPPPWPSPGCCWVSCWRARTAPGHDLMQECGERRYGSGRGD